MVIPDDATGPVILREDDDDEPINLDDIPESTGDINQAVSLNPTKRRRDDPSEDAVSNPSDSDSDASVQFASASSAKRTKRSGRNRTADQGEDLEVQDDNKKLGLNTSYDGFSIYGRILCLVVKRKGPRSHTSGSSVPTSSQQMLENWVSTQAAAEHVDDDEDNT